MPITSEKEVQNCKKKRRYRDESKALIAAWKSECRGFPCRMYRCPVCAGFHLTSQEPEKKGGPMKQAEDYASKDKKVKYFRGGK